MKHYDTVEYARSRLVETIIRLGNIPVMINQVSGEDDNIILHYESLLNPSNDQAPLSQFNLDPVPLGYVNYKARASYLSRSPMRRDWRQGARMINIVDNDGFSPRGMPYRVIAQTMMGSFPKWKNCLETIASKDIVSVAFHRDFCVQKNGTITYKGLVDVAETNMENGGVHIFANRSWATEALDEAMEFAA